MSLRHRIRALKRPQRLLSAVSATVVVLALGGVLLVAPWSEDDAGCREVPRSARALAGDPGRAAAALDPGPDGTGTGALRKLLRTRGAPLCAGEDGTDVAGRALVAAATGRTADEQDRPALPHGKRSARVVHGAVRALAEHGEAKFPPALAPYVARTLAAYISDVRRDLMFGSPGEWDQPVATTEEARYPDGSGNWTAPFPRPHEQHAVFGETIGSSEKPDLKAVVQRLTVSPEAYAILYDAERAHLAAYLERLGDNGGEPESKPRDAQERREAAEQEARRKKRGAKAYEVDPVAGSLTELGISAEFVATLARDRTEYVADGTVPDLAAYDRAVLRHTRGVHRASPRQVRGTPPATGTVAQRRPSASAGKGKRAAERLMDGRTQLFATFDAWVRDRDIPRGTADRLRTRMDTRYVQTIRSR